MSGCGGLFGALNAQPIRKYGHCSFHSLVVNYRKIYKYFLCAFLMKLKTLEKIAVTALALASPAYANDTNHYASGQETAVEQKHNVDLIGNFDKRQVATIDESLDTIHSLYPSTKSEKELVVLHTDCFKESVQGYIKNNVYWPATTLEALAERGEICSMVGDLEKYSKDFTDEPARDVMVLNPNPKKDEIKNFKVDDSYKGLFIHEYGHIVDGNIDLSDSKKAITKANVSVRNFIKRNGRAITNEETLVGFPSIYAYTGQQNNIDEILRLVNDAQEYKTIIESTQERGRDSSMPEILLESTLENIRDIITKEEVAELFVHLVKQDPSRSSTMVEYKLNSLDINLRKPLK
jgi:hypothetical protein